MSVSEERMMILKMLQEGKINSDEAAKLLEALEGARNRIPDTGHLLKALSRRSCPAQLL